MDRHQAEMKKLDKEEDFDFLSGEEDEVRLWRKINSTIKDATERMDRWLFNTAISAMMELYNELSGFDPYKGEQKKRVALFKKGVETLILLLNPIAPHICEELWSELGHKELLVKHSWPEADERALQRDKFLLVVQINGRLRARLMANVGATEEEVIKLALSHPNVQEHIKGKKLKRRIYIPDKLLNLVVG